MVVFFGGFSEGDVGRAAGLLVVFQEAHLVDCAADFIFEVLRSS